MRYPRYRGGLCRLAVLAAAGLLGSMGCAPGATLQRPLARSKPSMRPLSYTGVNLSGGDFCNPRPGVAPVYGQNFIYPSPQEFDTFAARGMNVFRIPFRWEVLQPVLDGPLVPVEVRRLQDVAAAARSRRVVIILDPHNFARYYGKVIGSSDVDDAAFADFWSRMAAAFKNEPGIWFGLMNEPHDMPTADWVSAAQAALTAIRRAGARNLVLIPGNGWDGAHSWTEAGNDALLQIKDPDHHSIFEAHQYLDSDNSGTHPNAVSATVGSERLRSFTEWCRMHHRRAFLGEFGCGAGATECAAIGDMLRSMQKDRDVWVGFTWWSAGPWWGNYMFSIEPRKGMDRPQMECLRPHLQSVRTQPPTHPAAASLRSATSRNG